MALCPQGQGRGAEKGGVRRPPELQALAEVCARRAPMLTLEPIVLGFSED